TRHAVTQRDPGHRGEERIEQPHIAGGSECEGERDSDHSSQSLQHELALVSANFLPQRGTVDSQQQHRGKRDDAVEFADPVTPDASPGLADRKSTRLNSSHLGISYAVFCLKKKK